MQHFVLFLLFWTRQGPSTSPRPFSNTLPFQPPSIVPWRTNGSPSTPANRPLHASVKPSPSSPSPPLFSPPPHSKTSAQPFQHLHLLILPLTLQHFHQTLLLKTIVDQELSTVSHWLTSYRKLNDTVSCQPVPAAAEVTSKVPAGRSGFVGQRVSVARTKLWTGSQGYKGRGGGRKRFGLARKRFICWMRIILLGATWWDEWCQCREEGGLGGQSSAAGGKGVRWSRAYYCPVSPSPSLSFGHDAVGRNGTVTLTRLNAKKGQKQKGRRDANVCVVCVCVCVCV